MNDVRRLEMRRELDQWQDDQLEWFRDVSRWQHEHDAALAELKELEQRCTEHGEAVRRHAGAIAEHERRLVEHARRLDGERAVARDAAELQSAHRALAELRTQHRDAHERIRAHHAGTMAQLRALVEAICAPM